MKCIQILPALFFYILLHQISFAQIGARAQQQQATITGSWMNSDFGYNMTLELKADGTGMFDGGAIRYTSKDNSITIIQSGRGTDYNFILSGNTLTLSGGDIDDKIIFNRQGTGATAASANAPSTSGNLIGVWSGYNETIEFTDGGQCNYMSQTFAYVVSGNQITLKTLQGDAVMSYSIQNDQLTLVINNQTLIYNRGQNSSSPASGTSGGSVAAELVGKWCYVNVTRTNTGGSTSERCITLNADGSYEYYGERSMSVNTPNYYGGTNSQSSDKGTWTYDGQRIFYNSRMGAGSGSYVLEKRNHPRNNDPMIVLDGETYVTYYQKASWR